MTKSFIKQKFFFVITKNLNWEVLGGGGRGEKPIYMGALPKRWGLGQFPNLRGGGGGLAKKWGVVLLTGGRGDTIIHTMI